MAPQIPNDIILFHYRFSPYARRIVWYLTLRNIPYAECPQSPTMPRPDVAALGVSYRRIPLLSIGSSIYLDTRLIIRTLERLFPPSADHPSLSPAASLSIAPLLASLTIDGGVFARAAQLIPPDLPLLSDPVFVKDRTSFIPGASFAKADVLRARPEAIAHMRSLHDVYETVLADGREWVAGTTDTGPTLADIEGVWPLAWLGEMRALDKHLFGEQAYPRTNAWVRRFNAALKQAGARAGPGVAKPLKLDGDQAVAAILAHAIDPAPFTVQGDDSLGLQQGQDVRVWPIDSGSTHRERGRLVGLSKEEVVIAVKTKRDPGREVLVHAPRWNFRIAPVKDQPSKL